ncbi:hypothetical protein MT378_01230 [Psychrobacter sp. 16-Bac2893]
MKLSTTRTAKSWRRTAIVTAILMSVSTLSTSVNGAEKRPIGDLEIYQSLLPGNPKLMIMIDVSSSMRKGSIEKDYGQPCDSSGKNSSYGKVGGKQDDVAIKIGGNTTDIEFQAYGCQSIKGGGEKEIDRLSRFQITLMRLLADEIFIGNESAGGNGAGTSLKGRLLPDSYAMGIGIFGYESTGEKATILEPVGLLTNEKRLRLINKINSIVDPTSGDIKVNGVSKSTKDTVTSQGVSIASALAEAGAYMMGTSPIDSTVPLLASNYSGFNDSDPTTQSNNKYIAPTVDQCSGKGIFMLTDDGLKKSSSTTLPVSTDPIASLANVQMMNKSLNRLATDPALLSQCTTEFGGAWRCTGAYARALRNPNNPSGHAIKTATAGIGKAFDIFGTNTQQITVDGKKVTVANCSATGASTDNQNLCKLGELKADATAAYGNGKFYPIPTTSIDSENAARTIATSISDFASGLGGIGTAGPAGTITVPNNPYQVSEQLPFAYLPMLRPDIGSTSSVWGGNLKKYNLNNGTLYGKSNSALYTDTAGSLSTATQDLWQPATTAITGNSAIDVGGVYANLTTPNSGFGSARTVYVEDITAAGSITPILRKVGVDPAGKLVGFSTLLDPIYTEQNKRRILNFLGFKQYKINSTSTEPKELLDISGNTPSDSPALGADTVMIQPGEAVKVLGGVVHSKPAAISYSATLDANGNITNTREDYALFGSMDGALHLVNAANDNGTEKFAIIPKKMIADQSIALVKDSKKDAVGQPYFGVDAPWLVTTDYTYGLATTAAEQSKVTVDTSAGNGMFAYGGLRMGGEAFYGINITNKDAPSMMFAITPSTVDFSRMGQTWSKPMAAKIRTSQEGAPIDVLVFGGGYDMQYESDIYKATSDAPAKGNAIYIVNANTGELIWSTSADATLGKNTNTSSMIHSITGGITVLDRDNDGLMDHIYAADLGGQVFRADFQNARPAKFGFAAVTGFSNKRVVRILNTSPTTTTTTTGTAANPATYRFYERPVVSFYRNESISGETISNAGKIFALVNVVSGDRSSPLSKVRSNNTYANRVYGIIDTDVTSSTLYDENPTLAINNLTEDSLLNLNTEIDVTASTTADALQTKKTTARNKLIRGTNKGWYYPLTRFDGYQGIKYNKGIGESVVINSLLYTTIYNPDKIYTAPQSCTTSILGGSERQIYCLPYGICSDANSKNGTGGYVPAGQGIQELTLGAFNSSNTDIKVLIGTRTLTDRINPTNRIAYGAGDTTSKYYDPNSTNQNKLEAFSTLGSNVGGDGSAVEYLFSERYTLQPKTWYEKE